MVFFDSYCNTVPALTRAWLGWGSFWTVAHPGKKEVTERQSKQKHGTSLQA